METTDFDLGSHSAFHTLELCAGVGMLGLGLQIALPGARTVCYVERNPYCAATLASLMEEERLDKAPVWDDVKTFSGKPWRGGVDIVCAGYPCQPFSVAGLRKGESDPRHIWPDIRRIVGDCEPGICFFENVAGHLTLGFREVRADLEGMDYRVTAGLFSAAEVGAGHKRERLFILGIRNEEWGTVADSQHKNIGRQSDTPVRETFRRAAFDGTGATVDNPSSSRFNRGRSETDRQIRDETRGKEFGGRGSELANSQSFPERKQEYETGPQSREDARGNVGGNQHRLVNPLQPGSQISGRSGTPSRTCTTVGTTSLPVVPLFAPGPTDSTWGEIINRFPHLAPATVKAKSLVRGVADGMACGLGIPAVVPEYRTEALQATGNGVVPLQAAWAFTVLVAEMARERGMGKG